MNPIEDTLPEVGVDEDGPRLAELVDELAEMNSDDWSTLVANGLGGGAGVRIEFAFSAPSEEEAESLTEDLQNEGYEAAATSPAGDEDDWVVRGTTPEVTVSASGLGDWVRRLAAYGLAHDESLLDGWSALLE